MKIKEKNSIEHHLKDMTDITDKLAALGPLVSEEDQIETLLGNFPPNFLPWLLPRKQEVES